MKYTKEYTYITRFFVFGQDGDVNASEL